MTTNIDRRAFLATSASALTIAGLRPGFAQQFPARGFTIIVPYGPGGGSDITARLLAKDLEGVIGKTVTVENRAGGNGSIAASVMTSAPADGYTLLVVDTTLLSVSPLFVSQLSYDPQKDFVPIAALARCA